MPLDARIPLQAIGIQAPDVLGAMAQGQQYRQNQMAMQAAQATAQRNAMIRQRAAATDFTSPDAVNAFVREAGPDATPYLEAAAAGAGLGTARSAETRAQGEYDQKANEAAMTELRTVVGRVWANPDDASLADAAQRYPQFAADIQRIAAQPDTAARQSALATMVAALPGGAEFLNAVTQQYTDVDLGGTRQRLPNRPYLPGEVQSLRKTADPTRPIIVNTAGGIGSVVPGQSGYTPILDDNNNPVMPFDSTPNAPAGAADEARANAAEGLRSTLDSLRGYYSALNESGGIVSTERGGGENLVASAGASLPGRVLGRTFGSRDQTQRDNIQTAIPMIVASLKDLTGMSAQQMNSNVELQLFLGTVGDPSQSIETVNEALARFERYVDRVAGAAQGGGGNAALEAEARRRGLIP